MTEKSYNFLQLTIPRELLDTTQEQLDSFTDFFSIPQQDSGLYRITGVLRNVASIVALYDYQFTQFKEIAELLDKEKDTKEVYLQIRGGPGSSRTGFASVFPGYECLLKTKHHYSKCSIFEVLIATFFVARKRAQNRDSGYLSKNAMTNVAREIRSFSRKSNPSFDTLDAIPVALDSYQSIKEALNEFEKLISDSSNTLKKIINDFCRESNEDHDKEVEKPPSKPKPAPKLKIDNTPDKAFTQPVKRKEVAQIFKPDKPLIYDDVEILIKPENNQATVQKSGELLDDSSPEDITKIDPTLEGDSLSASGNKVAAQATQQKGIMQAQFCEYRWEQLSQAESLVIQKCIIKDDSLGAIAALLTLSFGAEPIVWGDYKLTKSQASDGFFDIETSTWGHFIQEHKNAWQPDEASMPFLKEVGNQVEFTISQQIINKLKHLSNTNANNMAELLGKDSQELQSIAIKWLLEISPRNREITLAKLRNELYFKVMQMNMDEVAAHFICGQPTFLLPTQCFYTAFNSEELNAIYVNALSKIFQNELTSSQVESKLIGSKLQAKDEVLIEFVAMLKQQEANTDIDDLVAYHNVFTVFTHQLLSYGTGHRDVVDPFARLDDFVAPIRSVLIFDKETDLNHMGRISPMGLIAWQQFINYKEHLNLLATHLRAKGEHLAPKIEQLLNGQQTLPFLFLIEQQNTGLQYVSIRTSVLESQLPNWHLPFNFNRHYLSTKLRPLLNNVEPIDYLLGHFQNGTQAFGSTSQLSPKDLTSALENKIDQLLSKISFHAIKSRLPHTRKSTKHKLPENNKQIQLGFQERAKVRNEKLQKSKQILSTELSSLKASIRALHTDKAEPEIELKVEELQHQTLALIESSLQSLVDNKKVVNVAESMRSFYRVVKRFLEQEKIKVNLKFSLSNVKQEPSPVTPDTGPDYHAFKKLSDNFVQMTPDLISSIDSIEAVAAFSLINEIFLGRLHNQKWIDNYSESFQKSLRFLSDKVTIDLIDNPRFTNVFRYRYSLSSSLFLTQRKTLATATEQFENKKFKYQLNRIITKLKNNYPKLTLKKLLKLAAASDVIELSGINRGIYTGDKQNFSIGFERQEGLRNGKALSLTPKSKSPQSFKLNTETKYYSPTNSAYKTTKDQYKKIRNSLKNLTTTQKSRQKNQLIKEIENTLTNHSDEIYSIYSLILEWGLYQLNNSTKRKAEYINKKIHSNSVALIEVFQDSDVTTMSESDLIQAYNKIFPYYPSFTEKSKQVEEHAKDLFEFHEFLMSSFGVTDIDFSDLDIPDSLASKLVNANLINFNEYYEIFNLLKTDPYTSPVNQLRQAVAFCIGFNFGLRSGEVFSISIQDIFLSEQHPNSNTLTIQPNKIDSLKTEASKRNLPINVWLNDDEKNLIKQLVDLRLAEGATAQSPLLGTGIRSTVEDQFFIKNRIVQMMRSFTGDSTLRFHHLRHSFASWMCSALLQNEANIIDSQDPKIRQVQLNFNFKGSRKALFQLAEFMGHAHPSTTVLNYIHVLDQTHFDYPELNKNYQYISAMSKWQQATLRQWSKRYKPENLLLYCFEKAQQPDAPINELKDYVHEVPEIPKAQSSLKFDKVDWLIKRFSLLKNYKNIATIFSCTESDVNAFLEKINELIETSGYLPDPLKPTFNETELEMANFQKLPRQNVDLVWVKNFEKLLNKSNLNIDPQLELWVRYVHPTETVWVFQKLEQYQSFITLLLDSGINSNQILVRSSSGHLALGLPQTVNQKAYPKSYKPKLVRQHLAFNTNPVDADLAVIHQNQQSSVRTMNYYFFLAVLAIEFKKIISQNHSLLNKQRS